MNVAQDSKSVEQRDQAGPRTTNEISLK
jgi:hypothetical protein